MDSKQNSILGAQTSFIKKCLANSIKRKWKLKSNNHHSTNISTVARRPNLIVTGEGKQLPYHRPQTAITKTVISIP